MSKEPFCRVFASGLLLAAAVVAASCERLGPPTPPTLSPSPNPPPVQRSTGPIAFVSDRDGESHIYLANADGTVVTRLIRGWQPSWSSDGRSLVFSQSHGGNPEIYAVNVDGTGFRHVVRGEFPAVSPRGRSLAFAMMTSIDRVDLDGTDRRQLYVEPDWPREPSWSPDGQRLAFIVGTYYDGHSGLWVVNADGPQPRQLDWEAHSFAWSPSSSAIVFVSRRGLHTINPDGSDRRLLAPGLVDVRDLEHAPDGRLLYTRALSGNPAGPTRIFINDRGIERQFIPDAPAPIRAAYRDWQVAWLR